MDRGGTLHQSLRAMGFHNPSLLNLQILIVFLNITYQDYECNNDFPCYFF